MISSKKIDISSKDSLSAEPYSITISAIQDAIDYINKIQIVSSPHSTNMFDKNVTVDDETHYFESLRGKNHVAASICAQVVLISDSLQVQHNNTINRTGQKFPPSGNSTFF